MDIYRCFFRPGIEKVAKFPYVRTSVDKRLSKENYNAATLGRIFSPSRKSTCCRLLRYVCVSKLVKFLRILLFHDCDLMYLTFVNQLTVKKHVGRPIRISGRLAISSDVTTAQKDRQDGNRRLTTRPESHVILLPAALRSIKKLKFC